MEKNSVGLMLNQFVEPQFDWTDMGLGPAAGVAGESGGHGYCCPRQTKHYFIFVTLRTEALV